jgi:hypothetical protein
VTVTVNLGFFTCAFNSLCLQFQLLPLTSTLLNDVPPRCSLGHNRARDATGRADAPNFKDASDAFEYVVEIDISRLRGRTTAVVQFCAGITKAKGVVGESVAVNELMAAYAAV